MAGQGGAHEQGAVVFRPGEARSTTPENLPGQVALNDLSSVFVASANGSGWKGVRSCPDVVIQNAGVRGMDGICLA